jgi:hypothetical protein
MPEILIEDGIVQVSEKPDFSNNPVPGSDPAILTRASNLEVSSTTTHNGCVRLASIIPGR